jgi:hypothetical protein
VCVAKRIGVPTRFPLLSHNLFQQDVTNPLYTHYASGFDFCSATGVPSNALMLNMAAYCAIPGGVQDNVSFGKHVFPVQNFHFTDPPSEVSLHCCGCDTRFEPFIGRIASKSPIGQVHFMDDMWVIDVVCDGVRCVFR